jgi:RNA 2',3'-cyclic 3'-phosphodiesterase
MTTNLSKQDRLPQIRVFVAVELPEELRERLGALRSQVAAVAEAAKWVGPDLLHVTLRFLGEIPVERLTAVEKATCAAAQEFEAVELYLDRTGTFPHERNPRVLWVGMQGDAGHASLLRLQAAVEYRLDVFGFGREQKPFSPHITIARLRERSSAEERRALGTAWKGISSRLSNFHHSFPVNNVTVMRSDLRSDGPRYTPVSRIPLENMRAHSSPGGEL